MNKTIKEIYLHLQAPMIALKRAAQGKHLPKVFAVAALCELRAAVALIRELEQADHKLQPVTKTPRHPPPSHEGQACHL